MCFPIYPKVSSDYLLPLTSGNQTWQWTILHWYSMTFPSKPSFSSATFDDEPDGKSLAFLVTSSSQSRCAFRGPASVWKPHTPPAFAQRPLAIHRCCSASGRWQRVWCRGHWIPVCLYDMNIMLRMVILYQHPISKFSLVHWDSSRKNMTLIYSHIQYLYIYNIVHSE